jgi:hypothetical protein
LAKNVSPSDPLWKLSQIEREVLRGLTTEYGFNNLLLAAATGMRLSVLKSHLQKLQERFRTDRAGLEILGWIVRFYDQQE